MSWLGESGKVFKAGRVTGSNRKGSGTLWQRQYGMGRRSQRAITMRP